MKGTSNGIGIYGAADTGVYGAGNFIGVRGFSTNGFGMSGSTTTGTGVYGDNGNSNTTGYAGYFNGRVSITGNLNANNLASVRGSSSTQHGWNLDWRGARLPLNRTLDVVTVECTCGWSPLVSAFVNLAAETNLDLLVDLTLRRQLE